MGDDLAAARRFMNICKDRMDQLVGSGKPGSGGLDAQGAIAFLVDIQNQAKIMKARGIYRAAQYAIDDFSKKSTAENCALNIHALYRLIGQYRDGLKEIMMAQPLRVVSSPKAQSKVVSARNSSIDAEREVLRQEEAKRTLSSVIDFAKAKERTHLERLIDFAATPIASKVPIFASFETIMPDLTSEVLRIARGQNKTVSISFAADPLPLEEDILSTLYDGFLFIAAKLVTLTIETPQRRQERGLSKSAHMAVTVRENGGALDIYISCQGRMQTNLSGAPELALVKELGAQILCENDDDHIVVKLLNIPASFQSNSHFSKSAPDNMAGREASEPAVDLPEFKKKASTKPVNPTKPVKATDPAQEIAI